MNDQELITAVRQSVHDARMSVPPEQIVSRSRAIRASGRRRLAACVTTVAAVAAVAVGLGLRGVPGTAPAHSTGTIRTVAFTLTHNANGTDTLTITGPVLFDPSTLQQDLAQYGIRAKITSGSYCTTDPAPAGSDQVVTFTPRVAGHNGHITIDPAVMPAGTELSLGYFPQDHEVYIGLIDANSYTCTTTPPSPLSDAGLAAAGKSGR